jgi:hypothetical protein
LEAYSTQTPPDLYKKSSEPREKFHRTGDVYPLKEHQTNAIVLLGMARAHPWAKVGPHITACVLATAVSKTMTQEEQTVIRESIDIDHLNRNRIEFMRLVRTFMTPYDVSYTMPILQLRTRVRS